MESFPVVDANNKRIPNPSFPINEGVKTNVIIFTADSGNEQIREKGRMKRTFDLTYVALNADQYKAIRDFYIARKGRVEKFNWTHPITKEVIVVRFESETFAGKCFTQNVKTPLYSLDLKITEVI